MKIEESQNLALKAASATSLKDPEAKVEAEKLRLKKACKEFEAFFLLHVLKAMRQTVPESGLLDEGLGSDVYESILDEELSRQMAGNSSQSLAEVLFKALERSLTASDESANATPVTDNTSAESPPAEVPTPVSEVVGRAPSGKSSSASESSLLPSGVLSKVTSDPILNTYGSTIDQTSKEFRLDSRLIYAVILAESGGNPEAISSRGAKGLMQLTDSTATEMGVTDSLDPHQNIRGGAKYLRRLLDRYDGNLKMALAAYNAGPTAVNRFGGIPPFAETEKYVEKVMGRLHTGRTQ